MTVELTAFSMALVNSMEVIIIIVIGIVLIFGVKKIPELARSFGRATTEFEKARMVARKELQQVKSEGTNDITREKLEDVAETLGIDYSNKNDDELKFAINVEINKNKNK